MPVSKSVGVARLQAAMAAGLATFAENRVQEAQAKQSDLHGASWHMVGHLQSNKAGVAVGLFSAIHSVDSLSLAERLGRLATMEGRMLPVYLETNVDRDPDKFGFGPEELVAGAARLLSIGGLEVRGLMTVGRRVARAEDARRTFRSLRELSERLRAVDARLGPGLSMGMSDDFEVAVEEGATVVRIGRALFGERLAQP